ncbi:MAG TPA: hypothetical protein VFQ07_15890, partial [Candidatus Polarisedimenticolia bacterium]|nr:hypothetical protein [Candidatus Polarisedimenticolia bacterium]
MSRWHVLALLLLASTTLSLGAPAAPGAAAPGTAAGARGPEAPRRRARDLGIVVGTLPPGPLNAITDVKGVRVGQVTLVRGDGKLVPGQGPVRT